MGSLKNVPPGGSGAYILFHSGSLPLCRILSKHCLSEITTLRISSKTALSSCRQGRRIRLLLTVLYQGTVLSNVWVLSRFSRVRLCNTSDCSLPGSSGHGISQARIPEWVPCPPPGDLPDPGMDPVSLTYPALTSRFFTN